MGTEAAQMGRGKGRSGDAPRFPGPSKLSLSLSEQEQVWKVWRCPQGCPQVPSMVTLFPAPALWRTVLVWLASKMSYGFHVSGVGLSEGVWIMGAHSSGDGTT